MVKKKLNVENNLSDSLLKMNPSTTNINFKLKDEYSKLPNYAHVGDAGMDVTSTDLEYDDLTDTYIYHTGVAYESVAGIVSLGLARSSNSKTDCYLTNGIGLIDCATYRGYIEFRYKNRTSIYTRATQSTMFKIMTIPWYKKMFWSEKKLREEYTKIFLNELHFHKTNALNYAPYEVGDKIGQIVFVNFLTAKPTVVDKLSETERGVGGFGSTNKK